MPRDPKPATSKEAEPQVAGKSPKNDSAGVRDLEERLAEALGQLQTRDRELVEALEQQTATAEILRIISKSPTDVRPVLEAVAENAARLCESFDSSIFRRDGDRLFLVAHHGPIPFGRVGEFAIPLTQGSLVGRSIIEHRAVHVTDLQTETEEFPLGAATARQFGYRTSLAVPLLRESAEIGAISIRRTEVRPFTERQVALLQTFADQAVIAIENVRLFTELQEKNTALTQAHAQVSESLEQQTATAEILKVISSSPTDVQPVLDTVAMSAARLCEAYDAGVWLRDDDTLVVTAHHGPIPSPPQRIPIGRDWVTGRAVADGRPIHVDNLATAGDEFPAGQAMALRDGHRTTLATPLLREGKAIGAILIRRAEVRPFSDKHIALLKTFADQAVIAIENVRLFTELQEKNRALTTAHGQVTEALEQQTATSDVLRVISASPTDVQPVFDSIAASALRLCEARLCTVFRFDGELIHLVALQQVSTEGAAAYSNAYPARPGRGGGTHRAILTGSIVHIPDIRDDPEYELQDLARANQFGCVLSVPMFRNGHPIGAITVGREAARPFSDAQIELLRTFADQAVIAIENVRLFTELQQKNDALTEAHARVTEGLEQQTATSEVLQVISRSAFDLQPVLDTLIENAVRLCGADRGFIHRQDGEFYPVVASYGHSPEWLEVVRRNPIRLDRTSATGRAALERRVIHIPDILADPEYRWAEDHRGQEQMHRTVLSVPMLREDAVIGVITIRRPDMQPFTDKQVELVATFANQAVIAIENVRLFNETKEALEQQTATSEILRVISTSPTDIQPVLDAVAESAARLTAALDVGVFLQDGDGLRLAAHHGPIPARSSVPLIREEVTGRAVLDGRTIHVADLQSETVEFPSSSENARRLGLRTVLSVPLVREGGIALGTINLRRAEALLFTERQVALLQTFADQAVIAIENVRLFKELQTSNRDLTTALDQQTATSDILRVIAGSQTDVQPVFDAIVASAVRLLGGYTSSLSRVIDNHVALVALTSSHDEADAALRARFPQPLDSREAHAQTIRARAPLNIADAVNDSRLPEVQQTSARARGFRSLVLVPLLHQDAAIGAIGVSRREPGGFTGDEIALLQTFADQAVIAIENVRLFTELQQKNEALTEAHAQVTESLEQQTATSEILKVISSSPTDVQPVFDAIASSAAHLCATYDVFIRVLEGDGLRLVSHHGPIPASALIPVVRGNVSGRVVLERRTFHVDDIQGATDEFPEGATLGREFGHRTNLGVPLLREGVPLGAIVMRRAEVKSFTDKEIALLQTFADQAVIAIENVRLFKELEVRNRDLTEALDQQTATGEILRVISQSQSDAQPVFDTIIRSAVRLLGGFSGVITQIVGDQLQLAALTSTNPSGEAAQRALWPRQVQEDFSVHGQVITILAPRFVSDVELDPSVPPTEVAVARARGYRSIVGVPLLRDGRAVGSLAVTREAAGPFAESEIVLLQTFADQAAIAIENVRLFKELEARTQDLTRSVGELRALNEVGQAISSTLDLQAVLSTIVVRATNLLGTDAGVIYEYDEQRDIFLPRATALLEAEIVETMLATPVRKGEGATGRLAEVQEPVQVPDILAAPAESRVRGALVRAGYRALLAVPLVREGRLIGGLTVIRKTTGAFAREDIELLQTFAIQSALAIQNARLFREIEDKSRQLEVASQHKSEFLANMSHELRTPLNAIIGFSEVLTDRMFGELNEKQEEYLKDIYASGTHLLSLINDILDLSKIEAGRMELEVTDFDLPTAIENALMLVRERAGRRSLALHTNIDNRVGLIQADERKVRQVVLNLLSNAIKFTPEGGRIDVSAIPKDGLVEVSVSDTGIGIASDDQEKVFEEFRQVGTAAKKVEGTGLGLTLCRKFVELHSGKIWVKSQIGHGATFTFTLPIHRGG